MNDFLQKNSLDFEEFLNALLDFTMVPLPKDTYENEKALEGALTVMAFKNEADFLLHGERGIIPVEVKAETRLSAAR